MVKIMAMNKRSIDLVSLSKIYKKLNYITLILPKLIHLASLNLPIYHHNNLLVIIIIYLR
jgi:hypothetical protein